MEKIKKLCLLLFLSLCFMFALSGCVKKYTYHQSKHFRLKKGGNIAVSVWSDEDSGSGPTALEAYLTTSMMKRGFNIRPLAFELLVGRSLLHRIIPDATYSARQSISKGFEIGGELETKTPVIEKLLKSNEMDDALSRLKGLANIARSLPEYWDLDYLLVVHKFDKYAYAVYSIDVRKTELTYVMVISGNRHGFEEALGEPGGGDQNFAWDGDVTRLEMLRLAEHVASNI